MRKLAFVLLALGLGCAPSPPDPFGGPTTFRLTDSPFPYDAVASVDVFVVRVQVSWAADTATSNVEDFSTVATINTKLNLLALEGGLTQLLGTAAIPPGAIRAVRLVIDTDQSSITMKSGAVLDGTSSPGISWQSSAGIATLNATVEDNITVPGDGTDVVIDFDVGRTFLNASDVPGSNNPGGFVFSPVLRAAQTERTGSVSGTVKLGSATGPAAVEATVELKLGNPNNPSNTWSTLSTARTDANGNFKFPFVMRSSFYTATNPSFSYMVVATKGSGQSGPKNVTVVAGADNPVGVVTVPQS